MQRIISLLSAAFLYCLLALPSSAENVFYCVEELATGFVKENGKWQESSFVKYRFSIKFDDGYSYVDGFDQRLGLNIHQKWPCHVAYNISHPIVCNPPFPFNIELSFRFDKSTQRFIRILSGRYGFIHKSATDKDAYSDTDAISAGVCQKF